MVERLLNTIMNDGSRHFGDFPQTRSWSELRKHIERLDGARVTAFLTDHITEAWLDFGYRGYSFAVNDQFGDYWFFVKEPDCPDDLLKAVLSHCESLLNRQKT